jgi:hypothetical protein
MNVQISKKIALIELQAHAEVLYFFANLLNDDFELKILTTASIFENAPNLLKNNPKNDWIIHESTQAIPSFIDRNIPILNTCHCTIFITIVRDFRYFSKLKLTTKKIMVVHNSHAAFQPFSAISLNFTMTFDYFLDLLRVGKFLVFQEFLYKKRLLRNFDLLLVPSPFIKEMVLNFLQPAQPDKIKSLEFAYFEKNAKNDVKSPVNITIPGTISDEGRDYEMVVQAWRRIIPKLKLPVQLILAGRPKGIYGEKITRKIEELVNENFSVLLFKKSIPQLEYEDILTQTDFVILPLKKRVKYGIYQEINGLSKITGSVNDQIRFAIPALISSDYPLSVEVENISQRFKNAEDLAVTLVDWINNRKFEKLEQKRLMLQGKYTFEVVKTELLTILK